MHRIRVSLLIPDDDRLLFVCETAEARTAEININPAREGFWQLPGGGLEPGESVYDGAIREALEETSLTVRPERIVYVQEYVNPIEPFYQVEFIVLAEILDGTPTISGCDNVFGLRYLSRDDRHSYNLASWHDRATIWADLEVQFPTFRHLGVDSLRASDSRRQHSEPFAMASDDDRG